MTLILDPGKVRAHAAKVDGLADDAAVAADAATTVSFHPETYGLIGGLLVYPAMSVFETAGVTATAAVGPALSATSVALRGAADGFEFVDGAVQTAMKKVKELLR